MDYSPWDCKELDTTEQLPHTQHCLSAGCMPGTMLSVIDLTEAAQPPKVAGTTYRWRHRGTELSGHLPKVTQQVCDRAGMEWAPGSHT